MKEALKMAQTTTIQITLDEDVRQNAEAVLEKHGMDTGRKNFVYVYSSSLTASARFPNPSRSARCRCRLAGVLAFG